MSSESGISVTDLMGEAFARLCLLLDAREFAFSDPVLALIADDSDWHRTRQGHSRYASAWIFRRGDARVWAFSLGTACGHYPADPFDRDIAAVRLRSDGVSENQILHTAQAALRDNRFFAQSLVFSMADGSLHVGRKSPYGQLVEERLPAWFEHSVACHAEVVPGVVSPSGAPIVRTGTRYIPESAETLAAALRDIFLDTVAASAA
jgi:hypothetical protein